MAGTMPHPTDPWRGAEAYGRCCNPPVVAEALGFLPVIAAAATAAPSIISSVGGLFGKKKKKKPKPATLAPATTSPISGLLSGGLTPWILGGAGILTLIALTRR
jgi:hypothetical protein